jgi:hypothetical protein
MTIVKISCAGTTTARADGSNPMIFKFLPNKKNIWRGCQFFWNDVSVKKADYWIVIGDIDVDEEECEVSRENIILMTGEPQSIKRYDVSQEFSKQFGRIFTSQNDFKHAKVFPCRPPLNWWIDGGSPIKTKAEFEEWQGDGLSYDDFKNLREIKKDKLLSVFCSNKIFTEGHKMRFNFCQKIKNHFKDKIDWFGNGVRPIASKWDGIAPYKYHIALENFNGPDYWTEKLMDPLMVLSHPIYCGATNIEKYFSKQQISVIDVRYPRTAIAKIERLISENFYEKNSDSLLAARDLVMDEYNFFNIISEIAESDAQKGASKEKPRSIKIKKEQHFLLQTGVPNVIIKKKFLQRLQKSALKKVRKIKLFLSDYLLLLKLKLEIK